eukprot:scaffold232893_cov30-Tisochrysis_lutea.AAC.8
MANARDVAIRVQAHRPPKSWTHSPMATRCGGITGHRREYERCGHTSTTSRFFPCHCGGRPAVRGIPEKKLRSKSAGDVKLHVTISWTPS